MSSTRHSGVSRSHPRSPALAAGAAFSLLLHLCLAMAMGTSLARCDEGEALEPVSGVEVEGDEALEELTLLDEEALEPPEASPELAQVAPEAQEAPPEAPPEAQPPQEPPPEPPPEEQPQPKPQKIQENNLIIDQPLVKEESEPPPDTNVLGPQDRRVLDETQAQRRAMEASPEEPPPELPPEQVEKAEDAPDEPEPPREEAGAAAPEGEPEPPEEARVEPPPTPPEEQPREEPPPEQPPSQDQAARSKDDPGQQAEASPTPEGLDVEPVLPGDEGANAGSPAAAQSPEAGEKATEEGNKGDSANFDVAAALRVDPGNYDAVFGQRDAEDRQRLDGRQRRLLGRWQERVKATRAALENFVPRVRFGNHTAINTRRSDYAVYIAGIHRKIHRRWGIAYLRLLDTSFPLSHPLSNPQLMTTLEFVIQGSTGVVREVNIVDTSGLTEFDAEAIRIGLMVGPHGPAPQGIVSPDGNVYLHWRFHRDTRQCGTFGVSVFVLSDDGRLDTFEVEEDLDDLNEHRRGHGAPTTGARRVDPSLLRPVPLAPPPGAPRSPASPVTPSDKASSPVPTP